MKKQVLIFDWGDTIMRDLKLPGPMKNWQKIEWVPGAEEMLKKVSCNYPCCIATSASHSNTDDMIQALKRVGAEKYFTLFVSSADLGFSKPDSRFFSALVSLIGAKAENCISIGNLYEKDIVPAKEAGLATVWFDENLKNGFFNKADRIIHKWDDLTEALQQIEEKADT
jgi:FMN phosphatase YigB (HAD superfamily)